MAREPVALTIAGSDSSGGAGIQADLKTFSALGVYGATVLTALTAQNTRGVQAVHAVPADFVAAQLSSVFSDLEVVAIKTGMLATSEIIEVVAARLADRGPIHSVIDPVMIATSGDPLIDANAIALMRDRMLPVADLLTPNLNEAACLLETGVATSRAEMQRQGLALAKMGPKAVLLKGGHLIEDGPVPTETRASAGGGWDTKREALDYLVIQGEGVWVHGPWIETPNTHGTGCTLSAAIVAYLVAGQPLYDAVTNAKWFLTAALEAGRDMQVGAGQGPVDHLHEFKAWTIG